MGSKSEGPKVTDYYLSLHYGLCAGPIDALRQIWVGEKVVWDGIATTEQVIDIDKPDKFGGDEQEGGVVGRVRYLPGESDQVLPDGLAARLGLTSATCPGFRGLASLFFYGGGDFSGDSLFFTGQDGFYWGTNNPFLKPVWAKVTSIVEGRDWYPERAIIGLTTTDKVSIFIGVDKSTSMANGETETPSFPSRASVVRDAINASLDLIRLAVASGRKVDIKVAFWSDTEENSESINITSPGIDLLQIYINTRALSGGTNFQKAADSAVDWFNASLADTEIAKRVCIIVTDGLGLNGPAAATTMADLLDQAGGDFNTTDGTAVDCYGLNVILTDTSKTGLLDNTASDGVPVMTLTDTSAMSDAIAAAFVSSGEPQMNAAHIIHEALVNTDWGMGVPLASLDDDSFRAAADALFFEQFGLSLQWSQQSSIEDFVKDILNHINATLFTAPSTGLLTLKLIRNDYVLADLPVLDRDNCTVTSFARKALADTVNEINVTWVNPENEKEETVTLQDLGNIATQGGVVSDSKNYPGIRSKQLARIVAGRDLAAASWPLATASVEANRIAWDFVPGGVLKLQDPEHGIAEIVMRIVTVDYGRSGDSKIRLSLVEDIFGITQAEFIDQPPGTLWESPDEDPRAIDFALPQTLSYFHAKKAADISSAVYPEVIAGMLAAQDGSDTKQFQLRGPKVDAAGNETAFANLGTRTIVARATLISGFSAEAQTVVSSAAWSTRTQGEGPTVGGFILVGDGDETENELILISALSGSDYTLKRGVLDTVPRDWPAATPIWFFSSNASIADLISRAALDSIDYKVLPITSLDTLALGSASALPITLSERPWLPSRPANVKIEGIAFGLVDTTDPGPIPANLAVTWANRNRVTEDSQVLAWDAAGVTAEAGQTTKVQILNELTRAVIATHSGLSGSSYSLPVSDFGGNAQAIVRVTAERDGFESLQGHEFLVRVANYAVLQEDGGFLLREDGFKFQQG